MRADRRWDDFKLERELADREPLGSGRLPQLDRRVDDFRASSKTGAAALAAVGVFPLIVFVVAVILTFHAEHLAQSLK